MSVRILRISGVAQSTQATGCLRTRHGHALRADQSEGTRGNLTEEKKKVLHAHFEGLRMTGKHIHDLLHRNCPVQRSDIITLNFLIHAQKALPDSDARKRYADFRKSTGERLRQCGMGPLLESNPYECFVLLCMLCASPMELYMEVMGENDGEEGNWLTETEYEKIIWHIS